MNTELNFEATGGMIGIKRRLGTFTLHQHENGTFFVTDDHQKGKWVSGGWPTLEKAISMHKGRDDQRTMSF
jgi:hypothetical protein